MFSNFALHKVFQRIVALTLGLLVVGTPLVTFAQALPAPPPPPPNLQQSPPSAEPNLPPPPPPPPASGAQPLTPPSEANPIPPTPSAKPIRPPPVPAKPSTPTDTPTDTSAVAWQPENLPETLPYKENESTPPGYRPVTRKRKGLVIGGSIVFGLPYFFSVIEGVSKINSSRAPYGVMLIPVVGPFILANKAADFPGLERISSLSYMFDGIMQTTGLALLIWGVASSKKILVRDDIAKIVQPEFFVGPRSVGMKLTF